MIKNSDWLSLGYVLTVYLYQESDKEKKYTYLGFCNGMYHERHELDIALPGEA